MKQQTLSIRQDQTPTTTKLTSREVFSIWLADQDELTQGVYKVSIGTSPLA
jgi:hypothetical protein